MRERGAFDGGGSVCGGLRQSGGSTEGTERRSVVMFVRQGRS